VAFRWNDSAATAGTALAVSAAWRSSATCHGVAASRQHLEGSEAMPVGQASLTFLPGQVRGSRLVTQPSVEDASARRNEVAPRTLHVARPHGATNPEPLFIIGLLVVLGWDARTALASLSPLTSAPRTIASARPFSYWHQAGSCCWDQ
jgi:hypothetical protein